MRAGRSLLSRALGGIGALELLMRTARLSNLA